MHMAFQYYTETIPKMKTNTNHSINTNFVMYINMILIRQDIIIKNSKQFPPEYVAILSI